MTDPLGENSINPAKKREKSMGPATASADLGEVSPGNTADNHVKTLSNTILINITC